VQLQLASPDEPPLLLDVELPHQRGDHATADLHVDGAQQRQQLEGSAVSFTLQVQRPDGSWADLDVSRARFDGAGAHASVQVPNEPA
jgi:hypothetical protein